MLTHASDPSTKSPTSYLILLPVLFLFLPDPESQRQADPPRRHGQLDSVSGLDRGGDQQQSEWFTRSGTKHRRSVLRGTARYIHKSTVLAER